jgi:hypothetical protein
MKFFADNVVETSTTLGTVTYQLAGAVTGAFSFADEFVTGDKPYFAVRNASKTKVEYNWGGAFTNASPDTLARNVFRSSSSDAAVDWLVGDHPLSIYIPSAAEMMEVIASGHAGSARSLISREASIWANTTAGWSARVPFSVNPDFDGVGGAEVEVGAWEGTANSGAGIYVPSRRWPILAVGAANLTLTADHIGWWITFNTTAAKRTATLPAGATVGPGYTVRLQPLDDVFPLEVVPNGSDAIDLLANSATFYAQGVREFDVTWNGTKWRTSIAEMPLLIERSGFTGTLTLQNFGIGSMNFLEFDYYARSASDVVFSLRWYNSIGSEITSGYINNIGGFTNNASLVTSATSAQGEIRLLFPPHGSDGGSNWGCNLTGKIYPMNSTARATHVDYGSTYVEDSGGLYIKVIGDGTSNDLSARTGVKFISNQTLTDARVVLRGRA